MKKIFFDGRTFIPPYGQFSKRELDFLIKARTAPTKTHPNGRPLGRNSILLWLYLVNNTSGRFKQGFTLHDSSLVDLIPKASSRYEAFKNLLHTGYIKKSKIEDRNFFLSIPENSEISENEEKKSVKNSEISENKNMNSEISDKKLRKIRIPSTSTEEITEVITEREKPEKTNPWFSTISILIRTLETQWYQQEVANYDNEFIETIVEQYRERYQRLIPLPDQLPQKHINYHLHDKPLVSELIADVFERLNEN